MFPYKLMKIGNLSKPLMKIGIMFFHLSIICERNKRKAVQNDLSKYCVDIENASLNS